MLPTFFTNEHLHLLFFGGKGGVGKTTSASASAIWLAASRPDRKFLLISTDPAHSLFDSFELEKQRGREEICVLPPLDNLSIQEFDAGQALEGFKKKYERQIKLITDRGTYFDNADINSFFNLSLPGIDEVMGILEIAELIERHEFDTVIIDTAPTGHTLSMLRLPDLLDRWLSVFDLMAGKHHLLQERFGRETVKDSADDFLKMMHDRLKRVRSLIRNRVETEFVVVTIPEKIITEETDRLLMSLYELQVPVHNIIVNRVSMNEGCPVCEKRRFNQRSLLDKIEAKSSYKKISIPNFPSEICGLEKLKTFASWLEGQEARNKEARNKEKISASLHLASLHLSNLDGVEFIMVCGKGGVGKSTVASATALLLSNIRPKLRHQLYSIDPANSLSDCFSKTIGDEGSSVLPNLNVYELNAPKLYKRFQDEYQNAIDELFENFLGKTSRNAGVDLGYDRELLKELLSTSPPGLEELMALHEVISKLNEADCIILDTAPTGHFIRFLELPELVRSWLKTIFELLLKYRGVVQLNDVAEKLVSLSRNIRSVMDVITNNKKSCAVVVTVPEAMSIAETERLSIAIGAHKIRCAGAVVNMATNNPANCTFCSSRAAFERQWIKKAHDLCRDVAVVPYMVQDIRGVERLAEFGGMVWG